MQGQICDILRPQLAMNRFLPLWPHRFQHFGYIHLEGGGVGGGGSDIRSMLSIRPIYKCRCPPLQKADTLPSELRRTLKRNKEDGSSEYSGCKVLTYNHEGTPRRRIIITSSLNKISSDQLRNRVVVGGGRHPSPCCRRCFYSRLLDLRVMN